MPYTIKTIKTPFFASVVLGPDSKSNAPKQPQAATCVPWNLKNRITEDNDIIKSADAI